MSSRRRSPLFAVLAVLALFAAGWQALAASFEHGGFIPHAHLVKDASGDGHRPPPSDHGVKDPHHHLGDLDLGITPSFPPSPSRLRFASFDPIRSAPEQPVFGIEYPPRLS